MIIYCKCKPMVKLIKDFKCISMVLSSMTDNVVLFKLQSDNRNVFSFFHSFDIFMTFYYIFMRINKVKNIKLPVLCVFKKHLNVNTKIEYYYLILSILSLSDTFLNWNFVRNLHWKFRFSLILLNTYKGKTDQTLIKLKHNLFCKSNIKLI